MADNNELPVPATPDDQKKRRTNRHLPNFFRTDSNKKFLGGTMDVLTQPGTLTRISSYVGRRDIPNYNFDDIYINETSTPRQYYQLEPAFIKEDIVTGNVEWFGDYIDYINSLKYFGANVSNHSKLNKEEAYSWEPHIDWDKFTNYREYYWLPNGPDPVIVYGEIETTESTFQITAEDQGDNVAYIFTPDGLTANPRITLYRGLTYKFEINTPGKPFCIKTKPIPGDSWFYDVGVSAVDAKGKVIGKGRKVENGILTWTIPYEAPDLLYYIDNKDIETAGMIDIKNIEESAELNIEEEILGKKTFTSSIGIDFVNGLKVKFIGQITPKKYLEGYWYVEGVGDKIVLINTRDLESPATFIKSFDVPFDDQPFDSLPWDNADNFPLTKDYIVINRSSVDRNNWSRANRWFHRNVLEASATANKTIAELDQTARALRPIIEFEPNLKLHQHGWISKIDVDLVDTQTTDVFSIIEGSTGYIVDGEKILPGYKILFTADPDILVRGKIFEVREILNVAVNEGEAITVLSTDEETDIITVTDTTGLKIGSTVQFIGSVVGGLLSSTNYYIVSTNFTATTFSVSRTKTPANNGPIVQLTDSATLTMKVSVVNPGVTRRRKQLTLQEFEDTNPVEGQLTYITKGKTYKGSSFYFEDGEWKLAQKKFKVNQAPLFDLFDHELDSYSDPIKYPYNNFKGNRIIGYKIGTGTPDTQLGFPVVYRNINNIGDIEFEFDLENQSWTFKSSNNSLQTLQSHLGYLRKYNPQGNFSYSNGWVKTDRDTEQNVVRILRIEETTSLVPIDVYNDNETIYAIEEASRISTGNTFYIAKQDSFNADVNDETYWLPYIYKDRYKEDWDSNIKYYQDDIVRYKGFIYICIADPLDNIENKVPTNTLFWKLIFRGYHFEYEWLRDENYEVDDLVTYTDGLTYICIKEDNQGYPPTNIKYWKKIFKGLSNFKGEYNRPFLNNRGTFTRASNYYVDDIVEYAGKFYVAIKSSTDRIPTDDRYWVELTNSKYADGDTTEIETTYNAGDVISYGLYLYYAKRTTKNNNPTDKEYWTMLSSGSVYPTYWNDKTPYQTGDIVTLDLRPKLDYRIRVYVNEKKRSDLSLAVIEGKLYINFEQPLSVGDKVVYKIRSRSGKNIKGYYEIPLNWQNNPLNDNLDKFTFGEVVDHVRTIVENTATFSGNYPGINNLADLGPVSKYGRKFMQHTGPMGLSSYVMIDKNASMIKSLRWIAREYSEFKKDILVKLRQTAFSGTTREVVDQLLIYHTQSKYQEKSAFYFSDMAPFGAASVREYLVEDPRFPVFVIDSIFDPKTKTKRNILIYRTYKDSNDELVEEQLLYKKDYEFDNKDAFVQILKPLNAGDVILIKDYSTTDGCYIPYTPTKLGLYPLYEPMIFEDDTYRQIVKNADGTESSKSSPVKVIQGHDGSIIKAYGDYRDDVILEIERRIFNSVRVDYSPEIFNIHDVITGYYRRQDFTKNEINDILLSEFLRWNSVPKFDYNSNKLYFDSSTTPRIDIVEDDSFTYNYNRSLAPNGKESLQGYWRGVYNYFYDTDRPHSHPWEIQGFTIKPLWWDDVYGLAPYTSDNKIMWDNIEQGIIADPKNKKTNLKYARPGMGKYLPVDAEGNLLSPLDSGLAQNFSLITAKGRYSFGDQAPVETVWRRSSEYPFAIIMAMCVLRGSEYISKMWDRFTIKRNLLGQIFYEPTGKRVRLSDLPFANEKKSDGTRTITSGLANFIDEFVFIERNYDYGYYKDQIRNLNVKLRYRLGGFSSKEKIKVLLDSRSPNASGTVFLPEENYKIFYNKSSPVSTVNYSGVIVEKRKNGFRIDGYDKESNSFEIFPPRNNASDPVFSVGAISENYVNWAEEKYYIKGQIARYESDYFKAKVSHTSSTIFNQDIEKWQKLPFLPLIGGRQAIKRTKFKDTPVRIPYGTIFTDIQSVVDFLLGYQKRLEDWGFQFEQFSTDLELPLNFLTSAKEFMFWTLQNWTAGDEQSPGSVITLSPSANSLKFSPTIKAAVDNIDEDFYGYSIFKADGSPLKSDLTNIYREDNGFEIKPTNDTRDGIFHIRTNLVYQEHVILFDNVSIFNDIIYDVVPGYRQGRLKILGYKTNSWDGSYYTPGFIYDRKEVSDWQPNVDYNIGDIVKYQNYYYTALIRILNEPEFNFQDWEKLPNEPKDQLTSNFDYKIEQFRDYYSLESSNFNEDQQKLAKHLVGYQPRQYLENIINDEVSQYKFYQGYIREKGTINSINKLFDALRASGFSSVDVKEEWAFKVGDFGASEAYTELEFNLNEDKFLHNPQNIVLTDGPTNFSDVTIYNLIKNDVVKRSNSYDSSPFKTKVLDHNQPDYGVFKYKHAGYVKDEDVNHLVYNETGLLNYPVSLLSDRDKIWVGDTPNGNWNVLIFLNTRILITNWEIQGNFIRFTCNEIPSILVGDIIVVKDLYLVEGIYKVTNVYRNIIEVFTFNNSISRAENDSTSGILFKFESVRYPTITSVDVNKYNIPKLAGEKIWIDRDNNNRWKVLENVDTFEEKVIIPPAFIRFDNQGFGESVKVSKNGIFMFVSAFGVFSGKVIIYTRPNNISNWAFLQTISFPTDYSDVSSSEKFGYSVDVSSDGKLLVIGCPGASNVRTNYRGIYNPELSYVPGDIVKFNNILFKNKYSVEGGTSQIGIPDSVLNGGDSFVSTVNLIVDGGNSEFNPDNFVFNSQYWEVIEDLIEVQSSGYSSGLTNQGAVFVYSYNENTRRYYQPDIYFEKLLSGELKEKQQIVTSHDPINNEKFGYKVKLIENGDQYYLLVSSENYLDSTGRVQIFKRLSSGLWIYNPQLTLDFEKVLGTPLEVYNKPGIGSKFGYDISVMNDSLIAVSAPFTPTGTVYVYHLVDPYFELIQVINQDTITRGITPNGLSYTPILGTSNYFGYSITMGDGGLFVSCPNDDKIEQNLGSVFYFTYVGDDSTANPFKLTQYLIPPTFIQNERFGTKLDINPAGNMLVVSAIGGNVVSDTKFDTYSDRLSYSNDSTRNYELDTNSLELVPTIFDADATRFYDKVPYTGSVYVYNKFDDEFIYADKLQPIDDLITDDKFGSSISTSNDTILVGTPSRYFNDTRLGLVYVFDYDELSWRIKESQSEMIDIRKFKKSFIYNSVENKLIDNLDFFDPLKGRIPGPADQEIKYQTYYDPAVYQYGIFGQVAIDQSSPWSDDHIGEIWWDLSTVKWVWYEQGTSSYRNTNWGRLFPGSTIDIYEWTETPYLPSKYFEESTSTTGSTLGITGIPRDTTDLTYSTKVKYDPTTRTSTTLYYYWVKNKLTIPRVPFRNISANDIALLIFDPKAVGYKFISITDKNSMSLFNIGSNLMDKDVNLNVQFYEVENTELLVHRQYSLLAKDDANTIIPSIIETKWFDSLCGVNERGQIVPDPRLTFRQRYGASYEPRQSWFRNRFEALKQFFEYANLVLSKNQIIDNVNFTKLLTVDPVPEISDRKEIPSVIDEVVDVLDDLRFIGTINIKTAEIAAIVNNGRITSINIIEPGSGYKTPPTIKILGSGTGAELRSKINSSGQIIAVEVIKRGSGYEPTTLKLIVRNYSVLILSDNEALGGWAIHDWRGVRKSWNRIRTQAYNVPRYWSYIDWYASGYNSESEIVFQVEETKDLYGVLAQIGDTVKVNNVGGKWLLLQRKAITETQDFIDDYIVIGRQEATIKFSDTLYNLNKDLGFDTNFSYDLQLYDQTPTIELRLILESLRDNVLKDDLKIEYINLFFNSVHYALNEQLYVDWCFKTSFLKINHNVGTLKQRITFQGDELESYQKYIEEVKPYKSKIREFISSYNAVDPAYEQVTDFDLYSYYNYVSGNIERTTIDSANVTLYPWASWYENRTFEITSIEVYDQGNNYTSVPKVIISGDGKDASATAYIANNKVYKIVVDNPGTGFTRTPTIIISGGNGDIEEYKAKAFAIIGNSKVRTNHMTLKYDRISPTYDIDQYYYVDKFSGDNIKNKFKLTYAPDLKKTNFKIIIDGTKEVYGDMFEVSITETLHDTYNALEGYIIFADPPPTGVSNIEITYYKNIKLFGAADRIAYKDNIGFAYEPTVGMYGKDLGQLMSGVDYGGVQITSIDFEIGGGWDVLPWEGSSWDNVITTNDDFVVIVDTDSSHSFALPYTPSVGEMINVYLTRWVISEDGSTIIYDVPGVPKTVTTRLDDPYYSQYDGSTEQPNGLLTAPAGTVMDTFIGNGIDTEISIPFEIVFQPNDLLTFRKNTSDGTILPTDRSLLDAFVSGGDLAYSTAKGINAEEIIIDGDGLVTPDTSHGPEELVQGQVVDALDLKVYHTPSSGSPNVLVRNYDADGLTDTFLIGQRVSNKSGLIVFSGNQVLYDLGDSTELPQNDSVYITDFKTNTIQITPMPAEGEKVTIISIDTAGYDITEKVIFVGDGVTTEYLTSSRYNDGDITGFVTIDGYSSKFRLLESDETYIVSGNAIVAFDAPPDEGVIIQVILFRGTTPVNKWSEITTQYIPVQREEDSENLRYHYSLDPKPAYLGPLSATAFVVIDNEFLQAPDFEFFIYDGNPCQIKDLRYPPTTLSRSDIEVYKNGEKLTTTLDYIVDSINSAVVINDGIADLGDEIVVQINKFADFRIDTSKWDGSSLTQLSLVINPGKFQLNNKSVIRVTTFTNHDIIKIKTANHGFEFDIGFDIFQFDVLQYDIMSPTINTSTIFDLPRTVSVESGVFVALSRKLLVPNIDYVVLDSKNQIKVLLPDILDASDYIQIITFDDKTVRPSYGYRIFKDMINRFSYKRLDSNANANLAKDLLPFDTIIEVTNGRYLSEPNRTINLPGIIEIEGERIEYHVKEYDNGTDITRLRQIRRGTLGTGVKTIYRTGTEVEDIGPDQTAPYTDKEIKKTFYGNNHQIEFKLDYDFIPTNSGVVKFFKNLNLNYRGNFLLETVYNIGDVVSYNGSYYSCIQYVTGKSVEIDTYILPTDLDYWTEYSEIITDQWVRNIRSNQSYKGSYAEHTVYNIGEIVEYNGSYYESKKKSSNILPISTEYWTIYNRGVDVDWYRKDSADITPEYFVAGRQYIIVSLGTTNWNQIGITEGTNPQVGYSFIATGPGSGTGLARDASIPADNGQCDQIEVFVGGRRLHKNNYTVYNQALGQDSYKGLADVTYEAEFSVSGRNSLVRLTNPPAAGELVVIVYKTGKIWQKMDENSSLVYSKTDVAKFLTAREVILPK